MTIVIINSPERDDIDQETKLKFGWSFFERQGILEDQWKVLEGMRVTGGVIFAQPCGESSALYELVKPYLDKDGYISSTGSKKVKTKDHGTFDVFLYAHKTDSQTMKKIEQMVIRQSEIKPYEPIYKANWSSNRDDIMCSAQPADAKAKELHKGSLSIPLKVEFGESTLALHHAEDVATMRHALLEISKWFKTKHRELPFILKNPFNDDICNTLLGEIVEFMEDEEENDK